MARGDFSPKDYELLLRRNEELSTQLAAARRKAGREEEMLHHVRLVSKRIRRISSEFWGEPELHRSPYLCECNKDDPHRKVWVKGKSGAVLHCPFVVICNMGKLELRGYGKVPIEQIVELSKI